jgi:hypothetical protein
MKRSLLITATVFVVFLCPALQAAVFERDWKTPGDGLLTFDDVNKREWLDLSESLLYQFPGDTLEARYKSVVVQTLPGGLFENFTIAKSSDVIALAVIIHKWRGVCWTERSVVVGGWSIVGSWS